MSLYKHIGENWQKPNPEYAEVLRTRLIQWRKDPSTVRIERPTRLDRARSIGYRAKPGIIMIRQRVMRGGRKKPQIRNGRRPKRYGRKMTLNMSYQFVAELRAAKQFPNLEVINSYYVAKDGKSYWFEILMVDRQSPSIKNDPLLSWTSKSENKNRAFRGLTHAGKKSHMNHPIRGSHM